MASFINSEDGRSHSSSTENLPAVVDHGDEADRGEQMPSAFERLPDEIISQYAAIGSTTGVSLYGILTHCFVM
jgi:hypothetical protein